MEINRNLQDPIITYSGLISPCFAFHPCEKLDKHRIAQYTKYIIVAPLNFVYQEVSTISSRQHDS